MNYTLNDLNDVKVLIIFTLQQLDRPIPTKYLTDIFLSSDLVEYFTLAQALNDLEETGHIAIDKNEGLTVLTRLGYEASTELYKQVPIYFREKAVSAAIELLTKIDMEAGVITTTKKLESGYLTSCTIKEGDNTLLDLSLYSPTKEMSDIIENKFKKNYSLIYKNIIKNLV